MTLAAILTVAVSLSLVGTALLVKQGAARASIVWQQQTTVTVWMNPGATTSEINAVGTQLAALSYLDQPCTYRNKQQNFLEAQKIITNTAALQHLTAADMPTTYLCVPTIPTDVTIVQSNFQHEPGVYAVTAPVQQVKTMERAIHVAQWILIVLAVVLLVSAIVLILNTIRLAIFSRRREVQVMKLVGATNWFIRVPYITEGFMQGLLGSAVAAIAISALCTWVHLGHQFEITTSNLVVTDAIVIVIGAVVGSVGSAVAIRRFLDV